MQLELRGAVHDAKQAVVDANRFKTDASQVKADAQREAKSFQGRITELEAQVAQVEADAARQLVSVVCYCHSLYHNYFVQYPHMCNLLSTSLSLECKHISSTSISGCK